MKHLIKCVIVCLCFIGFLDARGGTALTAQMQVMAGCEILNVQNIDFGTYDLLSSKGRPRDAQGAIRIACTKGTTYSISIDSNREMLRGANRLRYGLYVDSARKLHWGHTIQTGKRNKSLSISPVTFTIYGRIPPGQNVPPGTYANRNNITVEW